MGILAGAPAADRLSSRSGCRGAGRGGGRSRLAAQLWAGVLLSAALLASRVTPSFADDWDDLQDKLYWVNAAANTVQRANLADGTLVETMISSGISNPMAIAIHSASCQMYVAVEGSKSILQAHVDGSGLSTFVVATSAPLGLWIDQANSILYWTQSDSRVKRSSIDTASSDYKVAEELVTLDSGYNMGRRGLVADTSTSPVMVYWVDEDYPEIRRQEWGTDSADTAWLDDTTYVGRPMSVYLDTTQRVLYWSDAYHGSISRTPLSYTSSSETDVLLESLAKPSGIAVDESASSIYWAEERAHTISKATLAGASATKSWSIFLNDAMPRGVCILNSTLTQQCFTTTTTTMTTSTTTATSTTASSTTATSTTATSTTTSSTSATTTATSTTATSTTTTTATSTTSSTSTTSMTASTTTASSTTTSSSTATSTTTTSSTTSSTTSTTGTTTATTLTMTTSTTTESTTSTSSTTQTSTTTTSSTTSITTTTSQSSTTSTSTTSTSSTLTSTTSTTTTTRSTSTATSTTSTTSTTTASSTTTTTTSTGTTTTTATTTTATTTTATTTSTTTTTSSLTTSTSTTTSSVTTTITTTTSTTTSTSTTTATHTTVSSTTTSITTSTLTSSTATSTRTTSTSSTTTATQTTTTGTRTSTVTSSTLTSTSSSTTTTTATTSTISSATTTTTSATSTTISATSTIATTTTSTTSTITATTTKSATTATATGTTATPTTTTTSSSTTTSSDASQTTTEVRGIISISASGRRLDDDRRWHGFGGAWPRRRLGALNAEGVKAAVLRTLVEALGVSASSLEVTVTGAWLARYQAVLDPGFAVAFVVRAMAAWSEPEAFNSKLKAELVAEGASESSLAITLSKPTYTYESIGSGNQETCGPKFCPDHMRVRANVPIEICAHGVRCAQAEQLCCDAVPDQLTLAPREDPKEDKGLVSGATPAMMVGVGAGFMLMAFVGGYMVTKVYQRRRARARQKEDLLKQEGSSNPKVHAAESSPSSVLTRSTTKDDGAESPWGGLGFRDDPGQEEIGFANQPSLDDSRDEIVRQNTTTTLRSVPSENLSPDAQVRRLLEQLQGEWRLFDGSTMYPGVVTIGPNGYITYDGMHWPEQDLVASGGSIVRGDGWGVNMTTSSDQELFWRKPGEPEIAWRRVKSSKDYVYDEVVTSTLDGSVGVVVGFVNHRIRVRFDDRTVDVLASELLPLDDGRHKEPFRLQLDEFNEQADDHRVEDEVEKGELANFPPSIAVWGSDEAVLVPDLPTDVVDVVEQPPEAKAATFAPRGKPLEDALHARAALPAENMLMVRPPGSEQMLMFAPVGGSGSERFTSSTPSTATPPLSPHPVRGAGFGKLASALGFEGSLLGVGGAGAGAAGGFGAHQAFGPVLGAVSPSESARSVSASPASASGAPGVSFTGVMEALGGQFSGLGGMVTPNGRSSLRPDDLAERPSSTTSAASSAASGATSHSHSSGGARHRELFSRPSPSPRPSPSGRDQGQELFSRASPSGRGRGETQLPTVTEFDHSPEDPANADLAKIVPKFAAEDNLSGRRQYIC